MSEGTGEQISAQEKTPSQAEGELRGTAWQVVFSCNHGLFNKLPNRLLDANCSSANCSSLSHLSWDLMAATKLAFPPLSQIKLLQSPQSLEVTRRHYFLRDRIGHHPGRRSQAPGLRKRSRVCCTGKITKMFLHKFQNSSPFIGVGERIYLTPDL